MRCEGATSSVSEAWPLIVKFNSWKDKEKVLAAARHFFRKQKDERGVSEDFSAGVRNTRRKLMTFLREAKQKDSNRDTRELF